MSALIQVLSWSVCFVFLLSHSVNADDSFKSVLKGDDIARAKAMLAKEPSLLEQEIEGGRGGRPMRPLLFATSGKNHSMMTVLIDAGADVNATNDDWSPLALAAYFDDLVGLRLLLDAGAKNQIKDKNFYRGTSAMAAAAAKGNQKIVEKLLGRGFTVNAGDVLAQAIGARKWELVKFLLNRGANPKSEDLIVSAAEAAPSEIIKLMLERGADANAQHFYGGALAMACNDIEKVKLLVTAGADVNGSKQAPKWRSTNAPSGILGQSGSRRVFAFKKCRSQREKRRMARLHWISQSAVGIWQ